METGIARRAFRAGFASLMNAMPKVVRRMAFLLIGPPGGIVWLVGVVLLFPTLAAALVGKVEWPATPLGLLGGGMLAVVGFAMMVCSEILLGTPRYRVPWSRFAACIGLDALVIHLSLFAAGLFVCAFMFLIHGQFLGAILAAVLGGLLIRLRSLIDRRWSNLRSKWQLEQHPASPTTRQPAVDGSQDY